MHDRLAHATGRGHDKGLRARQTNYVATDLSSSQKKKKKDPRIWGAIGYLLGRYGRKP